MIKNYVFIIIYILGYYAFPGEVLLGLLIVHGLVGIYTDITTKSISLLTLIYAAMILGSYANIALILKINSGEHTIYDYVVVPYIREAALIWCIGNTTIIMGYEFFKKKAFPSVALEVNEKLLRIIFIFIICLSLSTLAGKAINFNFLGGGGVKVIGLLNLISILIFARLWKKKNITQYRTYALILFFIQTYIALTTSYLRQELLYPGLSFMGGYFLGLGDIKYLFTYRIIPAIIGLSFFVYVFKDLQRSHFIDVLYGSNNSQNVSEESADEEDAKLDEGKGTVLDRVACLAQITNCVNLVKNNGFYYGAASAPLVTAIIPRFLWPNKPQIRLGAWFAIVIGTAYIDENGAVNNSINMTIPGELYLDFGWIGIILGGLLLGALLAMFWNAANFTSSAYNLTGAMWGGFLLQTGLGGFAIGDLQIVITLFSTYLIFYLVKLIVPKKNSYLGMGAIDKHL